MNKKIIIAALLLAFLVASAASLPFAYAASAGPNNGGTFANDTSIGTISWTNTSNAQTSNNFRAVADLDDGQISRYLQATNFGFAIPSAATIDGIQVDIERHAETAGRIEDESVRLVKGGSISGDNKAISGQWGNSDTYVAYGSSADKWGLTWTPDDINASNFGVVFAAQKTSTNDAQREARVDHIRITVSYTIPSQGPSSGSSFAGNIAAPSGDVSWSNESNVASSDNNRATVTIASSSDVSNYLRATGFGFSIPAGSDIRGIEVKIERSEGSAATATIHDNIVSLVKAGTVTGNNKASSSSWPTTDATATYGGGNDLWGTTWTVSDVNDSNFGVVLSVGRSSGGNEQARVDQMTITVYYTLPPNTTPTADGQSLSTDEDTTLSITLTGNTNDDGQALTFEIMSDPSHGTLIDFNSATGAVTYNPDADYGGPDSFTFRVNDGFEDSSVATVSITVDVVNDTPSASSTSNSASEDTPVTLTLAASDSDSGTVSFSIVDGPANGSLGPIVPTGDFTATVEYTPDADFNGADSLTFKASDGSLDSNVAIASITVGPVNDSPVANDDSESTSEDGSVNASVLANDDDVDGDELSVTSASDPANGSTTINIDNTVTYTPDDNYDGPDSFSYEISDGNGGTATATVTITVNAVNDAPVAGDDSVATNEDNPVNIDALANDSDIDGDALQVATVTTPANGIAQIELDGTITYSPNADFNGNDSFDYMVSDGSLTDTGVVTITIDPVNDDPVAADDSGTTDEDNPVTLSVLLNDGDTEGSLLSVISVGAASNGAAVNNGDGTVTYTPNANFNGADSFTYTVNDGDGGTASASVVVAVNTVNDAPAAGDDSYSMDEDTPLGIPAAGILGNDSDVDGDSITAVGVSGPSSGTLTLNADGSFEYAPNADFNGADSFTYKTSDGNADSSVATVSITVNAVNDAPVTGGDSATTDEDNAVNIAVLANDVDVDGPSLAVFIDTPPANGSATVNADNTVTYAPDANFNGSDSFQYRLSDGSLDMLAQVDVTVNPVNDTPAANDDSDSTLEDTAVTTSVVANDSDLENDALSVTVTLPPSDGVAVGNGDGTVTYTPNADFNGVDSYQYLVNDGNADSNVATVTITVAAVNDTPAAADDADSTQEDTAVTTSVLANDSDTDGDVLAVTAVTDPANGSAADNGDGTITYTPDADFNGIDTFDYTVSDGDLADAATVTITVNAVNDAPVVDSQSAGTNEDITVNITLAASDIDGDALTYEIVTGLTSGTLSGTAPDLTYTPNANFNGADSFTFKVNDGNADSNTATMSITVDAVNDTPVASDDSSSMQEDAAVTIDVLANDGDADGDSLSVTAVGSASDGTVVNNGDGTVTYIPSADFNGADFFTYDISDGNTGSAAATVYIEVSAVNDAPVADDQSASTDEDTVLAVVLTGSDIDGDALAFSIVDSPASGILSGTEPTLTYTPNADFSGVDSFTFKANDGNADSNTATVTIAVGATNDYPAAGGQSVSTDEDTPIGITLTGNDIEDGTALTYMLTSFPSSGTLSGTAPDLTYTPYANFNGIDEFKFKVTDSGSLDSAEATVSITANPVNDDPAADDDSDSTNEDASVMLNVLTNDSDVDGDSLSVESVSAASDGTVVNNGDGTVTYTPNADFVGSDFFTYSISDGNGGTATAMVMVTVDAVNDMPSANNDSETTSEDTPVTVNVLANDGDADGDSLSVTSASDPANGSATVNADNTVTYAPDANFNGSDSFTYDVSDGNGGVATATVEITVGAVNDAPVASDGSKAVDEDGVLPITASASDVEGDSLTFEVLLGPSNGVLTGAGPDYSYTPDADFAGLDSFTFKANDGNADSNTATMSITVNPLNDAPAATSQIVSTDEDTPVAITLAGTDPDGDALAYSVTSGPANGVLSGTVPDLTYTPDADFNGVDEFRFTAADSESESVEAVVTINVAAVNDAPTADSQSVSTPRNTALTITLAGADTEGDGLAFAIEAGPSQGSLGSLTPTGPAEAQVTYTPASGYSGSDSFTFKANDGSEDSSTAAVSITVLEPADTAKPFVSISSPANSETVNGPTLGGITVNVSGISSDSGSGIQIVQVRTETSGYGTATSSNGYATWTKSVTFWTAGPHQIVAKATDSQGNMQWHVINVDIAMTIDVTRPVVTVTIPVDGDTFSGPAGSVVVNVSGTSSDFNSGVQIVQVRTDTSGYSSADTSDGYATWTKSVTFTSAGAHQIVAKATDSQGNMQWHVINVDIMFTP